MYSRRGYTGSVVTESTRSAYDEIAATDDLLPLGTLVGILWKWRWVVVLVALLLTGTVVGFSFVQTPQYQASIKILVGQDNGIVETSQDAISLQELTSTMAEAVESRSVAEEAIDRANLGLTQEQVLENMSAEPIPETQFVEVSYTDTDPNRAQLAANAIGEAFSERISESPDSSAVTAVVWEEAPLPDVPVSPNPVQRGFFALMVGLMLGAGMAFLLEHLDDRWRSPEEAEQVSGVPTFGVIPHFEVRGGKKIDQEGVVQNGPF